ncbi:MAG: leucine-rich repeat protein [Candidatus Methanomethylophilaceae archaeon]
MGRKVYAVIALAIVLTVPAYFLLEEYTNDVEEGAQHFTTDSQEIVPITSASNPLSDFEYRENDDGSLTITKYKGLSNNVTIPDKISGKIVSSIGERAFYNKSLTEIIIPNTVGSIGKEAFSGCTNLKSLDMPVDLQTVSDSFYNCANIESVKLTMGEEGIGTSYSSNVVTPWQYSKSNLTSITISDGIKSIGNYAFSGCTAVESLTLPVDIQYTSTMFPDSENIKLVILTEGKTGLWASAGYQYALPWHHSRPTLTSITISDGIKSIGSSAFSGCTGIKEITIPDSITSIGSSAFSGCTGIKEITIPDSITSIGSSAFSGCTGIKEITIPDSITSIGDGAFNSCTGLTILSIPIDIQITENMFKNCTNVQWITLTVGQTGKGADYDRYWLSNYTYIYGYEFTPWYKSNHSVYLTISDGVRSIGKQAFYNCTNLKSLDIPIDIQITENMFKNCTNVQRVTLTEGRTGMGADYSGSYKVTPWYYSSSNLVSLTISDGVTSIGDYTFSECDSLVSVVIPDRVTHIGEGAFNQCTSLKNISIGENVTHIGEGAFSQCTSLKNISIGENVTHIGEGAFGLCTSLTDVSVEGNVTQIYHATFFQCTSLENVSFGKEITHIGYAAFSQCTSLKNISIGENVTHIGYAAFSQCTSLKNISIGENVTHIGYAAFSQCTSLKNISIGENVTHIDSEAFSQCTSLEYISFGKEIIHIGYAAFSQCTSLEYISFGKEIIHIESYAFYATGITSITIPEGVTSIRGYTFSNCTSLTDVTIEGEINSIGDYAFYGCSSLTGIEMPNSVTGIGDHAFYGCTSLKSLTMPIDVEVTEYMFFDCTNIESIVLTGGHVGIGPSYSIHQYTPWHLSRYNLTSLIVSEGVVSLGDFTFYNCFSLENVILPNSLEEIGDHALYGCYNVTSLTAPIDIKMWTSARFTSLITLTLTEGQTGMGASYYSVYGPETPWYNSNLAFVTISDGVISIGDCSFFGSSSLTDVSIANTVTHIGYGAFHNCSSLKNITIPESVISIDKHAFQGCSSLTDINVESENQNYASVDGILYDEGINVLIKCPNGKNEKIIIPESVSLIDKYAFHGCSLLTSVSMSTGVTSIGDFGFSGCSSLAEINIPATVSTIGDYAFYGCSSLNGIQFEGNAPGIEINSFSGKTTIYHLDDVTGFDSSMWSGMELIRLSLPDKVTGLSATPVGYDKVRLEWSANGNPVSYAVWYRIGGNEASWVQYDTTNNTEYVITNLEEDTLYGFYILATNIIGSSDSSDTVEVRTLKSHYMMSFETDGGSFVEPIIQRYGTPVTPPIAPTKTGHTFSKWNTLIPLEMPTEDIIITAEWDVIQYTIAFNSNGGNEIPSITLDYNAIITPPADPTKEGYTFMGWDIPVPPTMPANDMTLTASWKINQYTITFDSDGGNEVASITLDYKAIVTPPANPSKEGYTFVGWSPALPETMPIGDISVIAEWTVNQYSIAFYPGDGLPPEPTTQTFGTPIVKPEDPVREGFAFAEWFPNLPEIMPARDVVVTALWYEIVNINDSTTSIDRTDKQAVAVAKKDLEKLWANIDGSADESDTVDIILKNGTISFPSDALDAIIGPDYDVDNILISLDTYFGFRDQIILEELNEGMREKVSDAFVISVNLTNAKSTSNLGNVKITVPYTLKDGENRDWVKVYYIGLNNNVELVDAYYFEEDGMGYVEFTTTHFSEYVLLFEEIGFEFDNGFVVDSNSMSGIVAVIAAVLIIGIIAVVFRSRRAKEF